ncbi:MAG: hypothetical protein GXP38_15810 [Chloroflexi bacterium]|nr:hypothetical protein [Chloroflexota bacterium]
MSNHVIASRLCQLAGHNPRVDLTIDEVAYLVQRLRTANAVEMERLRIGYLSAQIENEGGKYLQAAELIQRVSLRVWGSP